MKRGFLLRAEERKAASARRNDIQKHMAEPSVPPTAVVPVPAPQRPKGED